MRISEEIVYVAEQFHSSTALEYKQEMLIKLIELSNELRSVAQDEWMHIEYNDLPMRELLRCKPVRIG